ncbi:MAG: ribulose-phosphate 3-epimerase [Thermoplasmataceae archaeon]
MPLVSPSIISCKLETLGDQIKQSEIGSADMFHLDIMDGHFVPNLTMGPDLVRAIRMSTKLPLEAHLMVERPDKYWRKFSEAGADIFLIHYESLCNLRNTFKEIESSGKRYGIVINPDTDFSAVEQYVSGAYIILIMSVYPGFSGQSFIEMSLENVRKARKFIDQNKLDTKIEVDGGINNITGKRAVEAGADILVSASYIYGGDIAERISILKKL